MKRKVKQWDVKTSIRPSVMEEAKQRQPPVAARVLKLKSRGRTDFARAVYPTLKTREAGERVARDIRENEALRHQMYKTAGYRPNVKDYTPQQIKILLAFYREEGTV